MKTTRKAITMLLAMVLGSSFALAQSNHVKSAERIVKKKDADFVEARKLIGEALAHEETKNEPKTYYVAGFIEETNFTQENIKQIDGVQPDEAVMYKALLAMYPYYEKALELDNQPDEKGRIRPRHTKNILKAFENNYLYYINAGSYYMGAGNYDKALLAFKYFKAIKNQPQFAGTPMAAADSNSMMVDFFAVINAYQANEKELAVKLAKEIQDVPYRQNDLLQVLAQTQLELTDTVGYVETMRKGLELYPNEPYYSVNLINTYIAQEKTDLAIQTLEEAIKRSPNNAQLYDVMGKLHENEGREEEAIASFSKALEVDPEYGEANYDMGRVYYNQAVTIKTGENISSENDQKAEELFRKALPYMLKAYEKDPEQTYYLLGNIYYQLRMNAEYDELMKKHN